MDISNCQLVIVHCLIGYCRTNKEKFYFLKHMLNLMPANTELIKWFTNYLFKEKEKSKQPLQFLYDHLIINSIKNDSLWIM